MVLGNDGKPGLQKIGAFGFDGMRWSTYVGEPVAGLGMPERSSNSKRRISHNLSDAVTIRNPCFITICAFFGSMIATAILLVVAGTGVPGRR
jgi:hypothetical protein